MAQRKRETPPVLYCQVGAVREACKGRKVCIPPEAPTGLRPAGLAIPADLTLGRLGCRSLQDIVGMEVSNVLARFSTIFLPKNCFANAFKIFLRDNSFKLCIKFAGFLGKQRLGCRGAAGARGAKGRKALNLPWTLKELLIRFDGKSLAQGQVSLIDPTRLYCYYALIETGASKNSSRFTFPLLLIFESAIRERALSGVNVEFNWYSIVTSSSSDMQDTSSSLRTLLTSPRTLRVMQSVAQKRRSKQRKHTLDIL